MDVVTASKRPMLSKYGFKRLQGWYLAHGTNLRELNLIETTTNYGERHFLVPLLCSRGELSRTSSRGKATHFDVLFIESECYIKHNSAIEWCWTATTGRIRPSDWC